MDNQNDILPELIAGGIDPVTAIVVNESEKQRDNKNSGCLGVMVTILIVALLLL